jgi:hypothetical protein
MPITLRSLLSHFLSTTASLWRRSGIGFVCQNPRHAVLAIFGISVTHISILVIIPRSQGWNLKLSERKEEANLFIKSFLFLFILIYLQSFVKCPNNIERHLEPFKCVYICTLFFMSLCDFKKSFTSYSQISVAIVKNPCSSSADIQR